MHMRTWESTTKCWSPTYCFVWVPFIDHLGQFFIQIESECKNFGGGGVRDENLLHISCNKARLKHLQKVFTYNGNDGHCSMWRKTSRLLWFLGHDLINPCDISLPTSAPIASNRNFSWPFLLWNVSEILFNDIGNQLTYLLFHVVIVSNR